MRRISVIVPFHGAEPHLAQCIRALVDQAYPEERRELIFVDNGGSAEARALIESQPSIELLSEAGAGAYVARNTGLRAAVGEIIAFTDADCAVSPGWLNAIDEALAGSSVQVVMGSYLPSSRSFAAAALAAYENAKSGYVFSSCDDDLYHGYTNNMAARSEMFREVGPFLPRLRGSDSIFVREVVARFGRGAVHFVPAMGVQHLEVRGAFDYCRKAFVHSRSLVALRSVSTLRPLSHRERLIVFSRAARTAKWTTVRAALALLILTLGMTAWTLGSFLRSRE